MYYRLDEDNNTIKCDLLEWCLLYETDEGQAKRRVAFDLVDGMDISTVFLGLDHNYFGGKPILFETMIFNKSGDDIYQRRYHTWQESEIGHEKAKEWVKNGCKDE